MMDARIKNQIGQPAASTIANTRILQMCLNYQGATVACRIKLSNLSQDLLQHCFVKLPFEKSISVYSQILWITLWMVPRNSPLTSRGARDFIKLPIFCK
jgi:hypothetical protein